MTKKYIVYEKSAEMQAGQGKIFFGNVNILSAY